MERLKKFKLGDLITTKGNRWKTPFVVEVIYRGYIVAVNRKSKIYPQFMFIRTYSNEVYTGSSRFLKYGINRSESIKQFIDDINKGIYKLERDTCYPMELILSDDCFERYERREQVHYEGE